jgi:hypothetical protein
MTGILGQVAIGFGVVGAAIDVVSIVRAAKEKNPLGDNIRKIIEILHNEEIFEDCSDQI